MDYEAAFDKQLAPQACGSCRKQKRRCDKQLPACGLCVRIGRVCDYQPDAGAGAPSAEDFATLRQQVADLHDLLRDRDLPAAHPLASLSNGHGNSNGSATVSLTDGSTSGSSLKSPGTIWPGPSSFPPIFFLDSYAFQYERFQIQAPNVKVPPGALAALGNSAELRQMIEYYFSTVHRYFPIVSKIRLYQHLAHPLHEPGAEVALLFLAMKLVCSETPEELACAGIPDGSPPQTQLYQDVKSFYNFVEAQNGFSIQMIQASLLIALYEMGHSIYPASYLSVGNSARVGHAMGLHDRSTAQMLPRPNTWTEQEERRRVWWGVIILDRFINIGHRGKPLATADPDLDAHLPTNDESWDRGQMIVTAPLSLSASPTIRTTPFARTCQAAHLLGKALKHMDDRHIPKEYRFDEALQIQRTLRALADLLPSDGLDEDSTTKPFLCTSIAICYSGLLTLYDGYSCPEQTLKDASENQLVMQKESIAGLKEFSERVVHLAREVRSAIESDGIGRLSPMVIECIYQAAANCTKALTYHFLTTLTDPDAWYVRESSDSACSARLLELKELLTILDRRWKVAGAYLFIVEDFWNPERELPRRF